MTDLLSVLPDFDVKPHTHLLPSLEKALITTSDLIILGAVPTAKRANLPPGEVKKLIDDIASKLHGQLGFVAGKPAQVWGVDWGAAGHFKDKPEPDARLRCISTLDEQLDAALNGGILPGHLVEVTGESGAGKTQLLLTLLLASQLPPPHGLSKSAVYISTEAPLATTRLTQLLSSHPSLASLAPDEKPSLSRILSIQCGDLETQDHILRYQLPVAITKHHVGLVILDSVAANYRAEFDKKGDKSIGASMAERSNQLIHLGHLLRDLAATHGVAIVVANQVADRFDRPPSSTPSRTTTGNSQVSDGGRRSQPAPGTSKPQLTREESLMLSPDPLALDHQQNWFTGWGDVRSDPPNTLKTPSLGLVWTNQISARIALLKQPVYTSRPPIVTVNGEDRWNNEEVSISKWRRWMKVVFAPWAPPSDGRGIEYEITRSGLRGKEKVEFIDTRNMSNIEPTSAAPET